MGQPFCFRLFTHRKTERETYQRGGAQRILPERRPSGQGTNFCSIPTASICHQPCHPPLPSPDIRTRCLVSVSNSRSITNESARTRSPRMSVFPKEVGLNRPGFETEIRVNLGFQQPLHPTHTHILSLSPPTPPPTRLF